MSHTSSVLYRASVVLLYFLKQVQAVNAMKELTIYRDEHGYWIVTSEKIPGFEARGRTQQEAIEKMKTAFRLYFPCGECKGE